MTNYAEFKSSRLSNFVLGIVLLLIPVSTFGIAFLGNEDEFLDTRVRRGGGILKLIEHTVGWDMFVVLMVAFGIWGVYIRLCLSGRL
jgi:hypothetical protein